MQSKLSQRHQIILINVRRALANYKITLQDLIRKVFVTSKQYLTDKQFEKVIKFGDLNLTFTQIDGLFNVLEQNRKVSVELLVNILSKVQVEDSSITIDNGKKQDVKLLGMKEVKSYLKENGPYEVVDQFDNDKDNGLDIEQLNNLLQASSTTFAKNKDIRKQIIKMLVQKLPYNIIYAPQFLKIFGLQQQPKRVILNQPLDMMKSRLDIDLKKLYLKKEFLKEPIFPQEPIMKKQLIRPQSSNKKQQSFSKQQNFMQPTPQKNYSHLTNSLNYYRLEYKYIQILQLVQFYLKNKQIFIDSQNPRSSKGQFVNSNKIFKGKFSLIQVAQSVIERQKNRRGLGLQFQAKDIIQGSVGNCYLLSSLSSIVDRYPQFVSNYFLFNVNPSGIYVVRLFNDGQWSNIVLDDRFPCVKNRPIYAKPHGNQIWVMLLQKAWAKLHGSYQSIDLGSSLQAFVALTGAPCKYMRYEQQKQTDIKSFILDGFSRKGMITCSGSAKLNKMDKNDAEKIGLIGNHAYSIHNVYTVYDNDKKENVEIIRIRNPWGNLEWKGSWSFSSKRWTQQLRQKYNYSKNPNDGSFYMSWNDFAVFFSSITICYMQPDFLNSSIRLKVDRHEPFYLNFIIQRPGKYVFSIYQQSKRKYQNKGVYQISQNYMIITKNGSQFQYIASGTKNQNNVHVQYNFQPGKYTIKLGVKWNYFNSHECVVISYGPAPVAFQEAKGSQIQPKFTADMINSFSNKHTGEVSNYSKIGIPEATRNIFFSLDLGLGYIKLNNPSSKQFTSVITLKQQNGLKLFDIFQTPMKSIMTPKSNQIYGFSVSAKGYNYSLAEHLQFKY